MENYTIIHTPSQMQYDTNDEKFYSSSWDPTYDTKKHLETLIQNNQKKFEYCEIVKTRNLEEINRHDIFESLSEAIGDIIGTTEPPTETLLKELEETHEKLTDIILKIKNQ